jgi:hypothetical protein
MYARQDVPFKAYYKEHIQDIKEFKICTTYPTYRSVLGPMESTMKILHLLPKAAI